MSNIVILSDTTPKPAYLPRILVDHYTGTYSADSAATNHPANAARSPLTYSTWKPDAYPGTLTLDIGTLESVDYAGIYFLGESTTIKLEWFDGTAWNEFDERTVVDKQSIVWLFYEDASRVRVTISAGSIATFQCGREIVWPIGIQPSFAPANLNPESEYTNTVSQGGQVLGRSEMRQSRSERFSIDNIEPEWVYGNWPTVRDRIRKNGAWFVWNPKEYPNDVHYGMTERNPSAEWTSPLYMRTQIDLIGP